jgi:hypothetical protein
VRRLLLAAPLALMLVLGVVPGAAANGPDEVSGTMADRQEWYSDVETADGWSTDTVSFTYKGKITIGDQTETASLDVEMDRTYPEAFFETGVGVVDLVGSASWDLRKFGLGTCSGPASATMAQNAYWQFPMDAAASASCDDGAQVVVAIAGEYPVNHPMTKVNYSHYVLSVTGTLVEN